MCWKEEWAYAIVDLGKAIVHVEKAHKKMEDRRGRAEKWHENLSRDLKHGTPGELAKVQEIIDKYATAEFRCISIIAILKSQQHHLRELIEKYGFSKAGSGGSVRVRRILEEAFKEES
jgi:hypothetical protein